MEEHKMNEQVEESLRLIDDLKFFLATAPANWQENQVIRRYYLNHDEGFVSCVYWNNLYFITGTDIVRCIVYKFEHFGRKIIDRKKFEEGIFSDLRNLKCGTDAILEMPKSVFLEFLYKNSCLRTQKKQKVFFWFSVPHDKLFADALERDLKKESIGQKPTTIANTEPSLSFKYDEKNPLFDQLMEHLENQKKLLPLSYDEFSPLPTNEKPKIKPSHHNQSASERMQQIPSRNPALMGLNQMNSMNQMNAMMPMNTMMMNSMGMGLPTTIQQHNNPIIKLSNSNSSQIPNANDTTILDEREDDDFPLDYFQTDILDVNTNNLLLEEPNYDYVDPNIFFNPNYNNDLLIDQTRPLNYSGNDDSTPLVPNSTVGATTVESGPSSNLSHITHETLKNENENLVDNYQEQENGENNDAYDYYSTMGNMMGSMGSMGMNMGQYNQFNHMNQINMNQMNHMNSMNPMGMGMNQLHMINPMMNMSNSNGAVMPINNMNMMHPGMGMGMGMYQYNPNDYQISMQSMYPNLMGYPANQTTNLSSATFRKNQRVRQPNITTHQKQNQGKIMKKSTAGTQDNLASQGQTKTFDNLDEMIANKNVNVVTTEENEDSYSIPTPESNVENKFRDGELDLDNFIKYES